MEVDSIQELKRNFQQIYYGLVQKQFYSLESERIKIKNQVLIFRILGFITALMIPYVMFVYFPELVSGKETIILLLEAYAVIILFIYIIVYVLEFFVTKKFEKNIKNIVMPLLMEAFGDFQWTNSGTVSSIELLDSGLFSYFKNKEDDDCFYGQYKGLDVCINETKLFDSYSDFDGKEHTTVLFEGVIVSVSVKKQFQGHTIIKQRSVVNNVLYEEVKLEDPEFTRKYFVDGSNQVESRYVLTPSFISRFQNLSKVFKADSINASLKNDKIILALATKKDLFALGGVNRPINDTKQVLKLLDEFISIMEIIDELKLNQNIGL